MRTDASQRQSHQSRDVRLHPRGDDWAVVWKFVVEEEIARQQVFAKLSDTLPPGRNFERTYRRKDGTPLPALIEDLAIGMKEGA